MVPAAGVYANRIRYSSRHLQRDRLSYMLFIYVCALNFMGLSSEIKIMNV